MRPFWLLRFGAACGVVLGLSIGVPGAIEAFTGETTATSLVIGLGAAFGPPALTALYLHLHLHHGGAGRFGAVAYALNAIGLGLFTGVAFALNLVLFFLTESTVDDVLAGPTGTVVRLAGIVFVTGTVLFGAAMIRGRVFPRVAAWGYPVTLPLLALLAPLQDTPLTSAVHVLAAASLIWLSVSVWTAPPVTSPGTAAATTAARSTTRSGRPI
jgi:hypothetical protein